MMHESLSSCVEMCKQHTSRIWVDVTIIYPQLIAGYDMPASAGCKLGKFAAFQYHSSTSLFKARKGPFDLHKWNLSNIYILS